MITLLFLSPAPGAGKTGVLAALALRLAYEGRRVLALRLGAADDPAAAADAHTLASLPFARGRGGAPVSVGEAGRIAADPARPVELLFLEAEAGPLAQEAAERLDARVVLVARGDPAAGLDALTGAAAALGGRLRGLVLTAVPVRRLAAAREAVTAAGLPLLAALPEDRTLYALSIGEIVEALDAEVILGEPDPDQAIEHILLNPITVDAGQPYFARRRNKAVITRSDKTDLQLAALHTQTDLLILTGGVPPSPYTLDRAAGEEVPLLLTRATTREAVARLEEVFPRTRFAGELKLARMGELLRQELAADALASLVAAPAE
jgi:BioD-like phosphotransacetylase family protein